MSTVLVVDDSPVDRRLVGGLLGKTDWKIEYAVNGSEAMECINSVKPDLIVTDLQMPLMDGLELVAAVKSNYPLIPTILMTSKGSEEIAMRALKAGAASYTPKHRLAESLVDTIRNVLAYAHQKRGQVKLLNRMTRHALSFRLDNDGSLIQPLINLVQEKVINAGVVDPADQIRIAIALEEALVNAVFHGNLEVNSELRESEDNAYYHLAEQRRKQAPYKDRRVFFDARHDGSEVAFVIRDEGPGFDPKSLPDPTDPANLERVYGRGLLLIRTFMDETRHNETGNEITMIKRRTKPDSQ
jgi:CheY-like chemotaxis protein/anti-sigma regulatory factor (Ser/Thr protein kinase)